MFNNSSRKSKLIILSLLLVAFLGSILLIINGYDSVVKPKSVPHPVTSNSYTKGLNNSTSLTQNKNNANNTTLNNKSSPETSTSFLIQPTGDFVSDHHPNLSGHPAPNILTSVCNTSPGATCQIFFSMNGVVRSLPSKDADSSGTVYWQNWTLQSIGLSSGSWKISVLASLGNQTKTSYDTMDLLVSP